MFSSIAQLNDSLSKMVKAGSDVSVDQRKIAPVVENIISDTQNKQSNTYLTNTLNALKQAYGPSELTSSISKMLSESAALDAQGNLYGAQTAYYRALKHFTETQDFQKMMLIRKFLAILSLTVIILIVRLSLIVRQLLLSQQKLSITNQVLMLLKLVQVLTMLCLKLRMRCALVRLESLICPILVVIFLMYISVSRMILRESLIIIGLFPLCGRRSVKVILLMNKWKMLVLLPSELIGMIFRSILILFKSLHLLLVL